MPVYRRAMNEFLTQLGVAAPDATATLAQRSLEAVRKHLGMDVAYISEFIAEDSVFRRVDAPGLGHLIAVGDVKSLEDVYCRHILEGRLPELIPDTAAEPIAMAMPITHGVPIGAHVSVPIRRPGGELYGMFCCLSAAPRPSLNDRDLHIVRAFAELVAEEIEHESAEQAALAATALLVEQAFAPDALAIFLQPICTLTGGQPTGFEALSRFAPAPYRTPDQWFADADRVGRGVELECLAIRAALVTLAQLPEPLTLSVNASPATVTSGAFAALVADRPVARLVLELTEHALVADYDELCIHLAPLRARGIKLAIDDAGAGFAGLQHILRLQPDIIKLDMALIRDIDTDPARRALASAMQMFARQTGAILVAEGVETPEELRTLAKLGFSRAQGYLLGKPAPQAAVVAALAGPLSGLAKVG